MISVLSNAGMREADRVTIEELGVPGLVLMETAASAVTELICEKFGSLRSVLVACGPGNNGGDGIAVARQLRCRGFDATVALLVGEEHLKGDAGKQLELAKTFRVPITNCWGEELHRLDALIAGCEVVVDALFGTGLVRPLEGFWVEVVRRLNSAAVPIVAVDVPSGLFGSSSTVPGEAIDATATVTFAAPKVVHALPPSCWRCGEVAVADIGIPPWVLDPLASLALLEAEDVAGWLPRRSVDAHKGHFGHLLLVAGRRGRAGAAILAARAAVAAGSGLVTVVTSTDAVAPIQAAVPEAMVDALPSGPDGAVAGGGIEPLLGKATAVAVGPGLGVQHGSRRVIDAIVSAWAGPLLLDADALTLLAGRSEVLHGRSAPTVLTPHPGELGRLLGVTTPEVVDDRVAVATRAMELSGATVLAKGARTVIVSPKQLPLINPTGTPGLASGGAGDVLTGMIGALLAQGLDGREAAAAGAWLHGRCAEIADDRYPGAVPASALVERLPAAERELRDLT